MGIRRTLNIGQTLEIDIKSLGYSADAVGRADGFVVFVSGGVPGDRVLAKVTQVKKNYALAETVEVISPSPDRCQPPCAHFIEGCGGCQWQHITYECQLKWKAEVVRQALKRIGKQESIPEIEVRGMESPFHYRNKLRLFPATDRTLLGMRKNGSHEVVPVKECLISTPAINSLSSMFQGGVFSAESGLSEIGIRSSGDQVMLFCLYDRDDPAIAKDVNNLSKLPGVASVSYQIVPRSGRAGKPILAYGEPFLKGEINGITYRMGAESFFQVNIAGLKTLIDLVRKFAGTGNKLVLDAHCGVGTFALQVSDISGEVWGTDISLSAVALARSNADDNGVRNVHFRGGTASDLTKSELNDRAVDLAILDPPRKGCEKSDLQAIVDLKPEKIIYVSCNPTTLARDLNNFGDADYKLAKLAMVDMFPMTYHLETVALCIRQ